MTDEELQVLSSLNRSVQRLSTSVDELTKQLQQFHLTDLETKIENLATTLEIVNGIVTHSPKAKSKSTS